MLKNFKYRIYPTEAQRQKIDQNLDACRTVYNLALEVKIWAWQSCRRNLSRFELNRQLPELRAAYPWIGEADSQALNHTIKKLDLVFKKFFNGGGFPKFKSRKLQQSFTCPNHRRRIDFKKGFLSIPKIDNIPIAISRTFSGDIKTITIIRTKTRKYFACIVADANEKECPQREGGRAIGIDLGILTFATISDGTKIENPKYLEKSLSRIRVQCRRISKKKRGSNNRKKAIQKLALLHERISNQRTDFLHKASTKLIRDSQVDIICIESLSIDNLKRNKNLSKKIVDASWGQFIRMIEYKSKWNGVTLIRIDRFYPSSKTCSNCKSKIDELGLNVRSWVCENCGVEHDRDINAAINIRNAGMGNPVELVELPSIEGMEKQECAYKIA